MQGSTERRLTLVPMCARNDTGREGGGGGGREVKERERYAKRKGVGDEHRNGSAGGEEKTQRRTDGEEEVAPQSPNVQKTRRVR